MRRHPDDDSQPTWFADRADAGRRLAEAIRRPPQARIALVLAIPRGGLSVAAPVAAALGVPLDILVTRKIGMPGQPELAIGAATRLGVVWNQDLLDMARLPEAAVRDAQGAAQAEVERREAFYRESRPGAPLARRSVLLVDDGLATGATMAAAVTALQEAGAAAVRVGVPVASGGAVARLQRLAAEVIAVAVPPDFRGVGQFYGAFPPLTDDECIAIVQAAAGSPSTAPDSRRR